MSSSIQWIWATARHLEEEGKGKHRVWYWGRDAGEKSYIQIYL